MATNADGFNSMDYTKFVEAFNSQILVELAKLESAPQKKTKTQVWIREVKWLIERLRQIDCLHIDNIEWITEDNRVIPYDAQQVDDFKATGLTNTAFIELGFYNGSLAQRQPSDDPWDNGLGKQAETEVEPKDCRCVYPVECYLCYNPNKHRKRCHSCNGVNCLQWNGKEYTCFTCLEELRMGGSS